MVLAAFLIFWFFYPLRSMIVMGIYSGQHEEQSVLTQSGMEIDMPSGNGWYPFVMTYNAGGFAQWAGVEADMTILYNFGAFDLWKRTSSIYDPQSPYYSSFYGAYAVHQMDGTVFGFEDGVIDLDAVALAVKYDYTQLVIRDFGCEDPVFEILAMETQTGLEYAGSGGWTRLDAVIWANGTAHAYAGYRQPYLQYGRPMETPDADFEPCELIGRVYAKYLREYECTVMIYVIAPSRAAADACDRDVLRQTTIGPAD